VLQSEKTNTRPSRQPLAGKPHSLPSSQLGHVPFFFCFLVAASLLLFASKSSPLYSFNDWVDANVLFTIGKGMVHGKVPYRDLFDLKGPLTYLIFGIGSLIAKRTFYGVYVLEVVAVSFFLYYAGKTITLFGSRTLALLMVPVLAAIAVNTAAFSNGASAEEFCLPLVAFSLYSMMRMQMGNDSSTLDNARPVLNGICAGCAFCIKYSLMGFWLAWVLILLDVHNAPGRRVMGMRGLAMFVAGLLLAMLPWVVYFAVHGALGDLYQMYFWLNLNGYAVPLGIGQRLAFVGSLLVSNLGANPVLAIFLVIGLLGSPFILPRGRGFLQRFAVFMAFLLLGMSVYGGGREYGYYFLIFAPLATVGFCVLVRTVSSRPRIALKPPAAWAGAALVLLTGLAYSATLNPNRLAPQVARRDLVQYKFAAIINRSQDRTLLTYGVLDVGVYTAAGIVPNTRYFFLPNLVHKVFPELMLEQDRYIREGVVNFVVARVLPDREDVPFAAADPAGRYTLVATGRQVFMGIDFKYLLYQRRDSP